MTEQLAWRDNHALFEQELKKGHKWQLKVGEVLLDAGIPAVVSGIQPVQYTRNKAYNYPEDRDIFIEPDFVIEVKSRNLHFVSPYTFPFDTTIIDTVRGWDQKEPEPRAVAIVSQLTGTILCINVQESKHAWTKEVIWDSVRQIRDNTYLCPKKYFRPFDELVEWLGKNYVEV
jgi:hypothetical protein